MASTVHKFVKGKLPIITASKDDSLTGRIRTRASITEDLPSKTKTNLAGDLALRRRRQGRLAELEERVEGTAISLPLAAYFHLLGDSICDYPHHPLPRTV